MSGEGLHKVSSAGKSSHKRSTSRIGALISQQSVCQHAILLYQKEKRMFLQGFVGNIIDSFTEKYANVEFVIERFQ